MNLHSSGQWTNASVGTALYTDTPPTGGGTAASCLVSSSLSEGILVECELHVRGVVHDYA